MEGIIKASFFQDFTTALAQTLGIAVYLRKNVDSDNVSLIAVFVDGAWSKRSCKVNFNASSGVGVIVRKAYWKITIFRY